MPQCGQYRVNGIITQLCLDVLCCDFSWQYLTIYSIQFSVYIFISSAGRTIRSSYKLIKCCLPVYLSVCVHVSMSTKVAQIVTAAQRDM